MKVTKLAYTIGSYGPENDPKVSVIECKSLKALHEKEKEEYRKEYFGKDVEEWVEEAFDEFSCITEGVGFVGMEEGPVVDLVPEGKEKFYVENWADGWDKFFERN